MRIHAAVDSTAFGTSNATLSCVTPQRHGGICHFQPFASLRHPWHGLRGGEAEPAVGDFHVRQPCSAQLCCRESSLRLVHCALRAQLQPDTRRLCQRARVQRLPGGGGGPECVVLRALPCTAPALAAHGQPLTPSLSAVLSLGTKAEAAATKAKVQAYAVAHADRIVAARVRKVCLARATSRVSGPVPCLMAASPMFAGGARARSWRRGRGPRHRGALFLPHLARLVLAHALTCPENSTFPSTCVRRRRHRPRQKEPHRGHRCVSVLSLLRRLPNALERHWGDVGVATQGGYQPVPVVACQPQPRAPAPAMGISSTARPAAALYDEAQTARQRERRAAFAGGFTDGAHDAYVACAVLAGS